MMEALIEAQGRVRKAAIILSCSRSYLYKLIEEYRNEVNFIRYREKDAGKILEIMLKANVAPAARERQAIVHQLLQLRLRQKECRAGLNLLTRYKGLVQNKIL